MSLTPKQAAFIEAYLVDPNGTKAAIAAGYAPRSAAVTASRLLTVAKVVDELDRRRKLLAVRSGITPEMVVAELARIGFADIRQVVGWRAINRTLFTDKGEPADVPGVVLEVKDSEELQAAAAAAIAEVAQSKDGTVRIKMHDKVGALVRIGQHLGMFKTAAAAEEPGKKEQAETHSRTAHKGTDWDGLLQ